MMSYLDAEIEMREREPSHAPAALKSPQLADTVPKGPLGFIP